MTGPFPTGSFRKVGRGSSPRPVKLRRATIRAIFQCESRRPKSSVEASHEFGGQGCDFLSVERVVPTRCRAGPGTDSSREADPFQGEQRPVRANVPRDLLLAIIEQTDTDLKMYLASGGDLRRLPRPRRKVAHTLLYADQMQLEDIHYALWFIYSPEAERICEKLALPFDPEDIRQQLRLPRVP